MNRGRLLCYVCLAAGATSGVGLVLRTCDLSSVASNKLSLGPDMRTVKAGETSPFRLRFAAPLGEPLEFSDLDFLRHRFALRRGADLAKVVHLLHLCCSNPAAPLEAGDRTGSISELSSVLLDQRRAAEWYPGHSFFIIHTAHGLRYVTSTAGVAGDITAQPHVDQVLALFADLNLPATTRLHVMHGDAALEDVLRDCLANFQLSGEFEWSVLGLIRYSPSDHVWENRFGESYTLDDIVRALIAKPLSSASCGGTHTLFTLGAIAQISSLHRGLSREVADLLDRYLCATLNHVIETQLADGSFDPKWYCSVETAAWYQGLVTKVRRELPDRAWLATGAGRAACIEPLSPMVEKTQKVLATGHHLEWIGLLPSREQPSREPIEKAAQFLHDSLISAEDEQIEASFCPYSHALSALVYLSSKNVAG
ncbi:MAG TPA: hypothetical protein VFI31_13405 [Pirellulales bacterium]|nr:hypothetical protein [Pirellulales bacterium]